MEQGFIDLRQNGHGQGMGESFWPSFTDIMTVVVMIFIITSTVLIVRNWELLAELQQTAKAERNARNLALLQQETAQTLEAQLAQLQSRLSDAHIRNLRLMEENRQHEARLSTQARQLGALRNDKGQLQDVLRTVKRHHEILSDEHEQIQAAYRNEQLQRDQLQQEYARRGQRLMSLLEQVEQQETLISQHRLEVSETQQKAAVLRQQLSELKGEHETLEAKYQALIQPARTAEGKQVVDVRYGRHDGREHIQLRTPGMSDYREVSKVDMHKSLSLLKRRYRQHLYVKIIIPSDSGLSYNEAWEFTRSLLSRYDYYYNRPGPSRN